MEEKDFLSKLTELETTVKEAATKEAKADAAKQLKEFEDKHKDVLDGAKEVTELKKQVDQLQKDATENQKVIDEYVAGKKNFNINTRKSFDNEVNEKLSKKEAELKSLKDNKSAPGLSFDIPLEIKAAATMTLSNYSGGTVGLTSFDPEFGRIPTRTPLLRQIVNVRPVTGMYVAWAEMANRDGAVNTVAEGAAKPQIDFDIVEASKKVEKIAGYIKASKESLADISFLQSEINQELITQINLKLDSQLYSGNGTTPNLKGIVTYAPTFAVASTPLALGIEGANRFDVIRAAAYIVAANNFTPNYIVINPVDAAMMELAKNTQGSYILPPFYTNGGGTIAGLRVVTSTVVTAGDFLVGDFTRSHLGIREEINIQVGYENDDFTKNLVTILGEMRAVHYIKTNDVNAFVKGTFSTAEALMETA